MAKGMTDGAYLGDCPSTEVSITHVQRAHEIDEGTVGMPLRHSAQMGRTHIGGTFGQLIHGKLGEQVLQRPRPQGGTVPGKEIVPRGGEAKTPTNQKPCRRSRRFDTPSPERCKREVA